MQVSIYYMTLNRHFTCYFAIKRDFTCYFAIKHDFSANSKCYVVNPLVTNGLSHLYHLDESILNFRVIRSKISFLFHFSIKIK